jgi:hypothetical protein
MTNNVFTGVSLVRVALAFRLGPSQAGEGEPLIEPTAGLGFDIDQRLARRNLNDDDLGTLHRRVCRWNRAAWASWPSLQAAG